MFKATAAYEEVMVRAHQRSELLKYGLLIAQFPAYATEPSVSVQERSVEWQVHVLRSGCQLEGRTSMLFSEHEMQSQACGGRASTDGGRATRTNARLSSEWDKLRTNSMTSCLIWGPPARVACTQRPRTDRQQTARDGGTRPPIKECIQSIPPVS